MSLILLVSLLALFCTLPTCAANNEIVNIFFLSFVAAYLLRYNETIQLIANKIPHTNELVIADSGIEVTLAFPFSREGTFLRRRMKGDLALFPCPGLR